MQSVQLFITCLIDTLLPRIGESVVLILNRSGVAVNFPVGQTCCGQPAYNAGLRNEARKSAKHTIQVLEKSSDPVVIPSGSCTAMIRHGYPELFSDDPVWFPRAEELANRTYELTEYLVDYLGISSLGTSFTGKITYHPSCHLYRELGVDRQPRLLLNNIEGADLVELPHQEDCCGFGGVFSVKHPKISTEMLKRKIKNLKSTQATTVVVCDTGCLIHIAGGLHRLNQSLRVLHIAEILASVEE